MKACSAGAEDPSF